MADRKKIEHNRNEYNSFEKDKKEYKEDKEYLVKKYSSRE